MSLTHSEEERLGRPFLSVLTGAYRMACDRVRVVDLTPILLGVDLRYKERRRYDVLHRRKERKERAR